MFKHVFIYNCFCFLFFPDHYFPKGCVLETILSAQKLDTIDSSLANQMFQFLSSDNNSDAQDEDVISELISSIVPDGYLQVDKRENESQNDYYLRKVIENHILNFKF